MHALARTLLPDRREIRGAVQLGIADVCGTHREIELQHLVGVECIDPARPPIALPFDERELPAQVFEGGLHAVKDDIAIDQAIDEIEVATDLGAVDRFDQLVGVEPRIVADLHEEFQQVEETQVVGGCAQQDGGLVADIEPVGACMAYGAVEPDTFNA